MGGEGGRRRREGTKSIQWDGSRANHGALIRFAEPSTAVCRLALPVRTSYISRVATVRPVLGNCPLEDGRLVALRKEAPFENTQVAVSRRAPAGAPLQLA